jgi:hypothetical protein
VPLPVAEWTVHIGYAAAEDGVLSVAMDGGEPVEAPVLAGESVVFVRLSGGASTLRVTIETAGLSICVYGGVVGLPVA